MDINITQKDEIMILNDDDPNRLFTPFHPFLHFPSLPFPALPTIPFPYTHKLNPHHFTVKNHWSSSPTSTGLSFILLSACDKGGTFQKISHLPPSLLPSFSISMSPSFHLSIHHHHRTLKDPPNPKTQYPKRNASPIMNIQFLISHSQFPFSFPRRPRPHPTLKRRK